MGSKILLYDVNGEKIGETFMRRARQLVKQQRAEWTDDSQSAIRFSQDMEEWETSALTREDTSAEADGVKDAWLIALAENRIRERNRFVIHSIAAIPVWLLLFITAGTLTNDLVMPFFFTGVCLTAYLIHLYYFITTRRVIRPYRNWEERRERILAAEVAYLKAELQK